MKNRKLYAVLLVAAALGMTACGKSTPAATEEVETRNYAIPDDFAPAYYTEETELPGGAYYIVHEEGDEIRYYPLLSIEKEYSGTRSDVAGTDLSRLCWVNYNQDEGLIPTMHKGDSMIYKSNTYIPTSYYLEKFFDEGYTLGVSGLYQDSSSNYRYNSNDCATLSTSDLEGLTNLDADSIYIITIDRNALDPTMISPSGTVTGLDLMQSYELDIRTGTEQVLASATCNAHYFTSAETYKFTEFTFITEHVAKLAIPDYTTTGYYMLGDGFFRYVADDTTDYHDLTEDDYNETIYVYNEDKQITGTNIGLVFNANSVLVMPSEGNANVFDPGTIGAYLVESGVDVYELSQEFDIDRAKFYDMLSDDASTYQVLDVDTVIEDLRNQVKTDKLLSGEISLDDLATQATDDTEENSGDRCTVETVSLPVSYEGGNYYDITFTNYTTGNVIAARYYIADDALGVYPPVEQVSYYIETIGTTHDDYQGLEIKSIEEIEAVAPGNTESDTTTDIIDETESEEATNE